MMLTALHRTSPSAAWPCRLPYLLNPYPMHLDSLLWYISARSVQRNSGLHTKFAPSLTVTAHFVSFSLLLYTDAGKKGRTKGCATLNCSGKMGVNSYYTPCHVMASMLP